MRKLFILFVISLLASCGEETLPKPKAFLSLNYDDASYQNLELKRPYTFEVPQNTVIKDEPRTG